MTGSGPSQVRTPLTRVAAKAAVVILVGVVGVLAFQARQTLVVVFIGFFLATGIEPAVRALGRRGLRRGLAVALVVLLVLVTATAVVAVLVVPAVRQIGELVGQVPELLGRVGTRIGGPGTSVGAALVDPSTHQQVVQASQQLGQFVASTATAVFSAFGLVLGGAFASLTALVLMIYFSLAMPRIRAGVAESLGREDRVTTMDEALGRVGGYVSGQLLVSAIAGVAAFVFFAIAGVPYPALLALIVAVLDAVPQVGAALASVVGVGVALSQSWGLAVATLIFFCVYQAAENYLVAPRVFSRAIELSPAAAFVALLVGASVGGLLGALTALPLTAAGKVVLRQALVERRRGTAIGERTSALLESET